MFILCSDTLLRGLRVASQGLGIQLYIPAPEANPISHLLFVDDCLLLRYATVWCAQGFRFILECYYLAYGQRVNCPKTPTLLRHSIREILEVDEHCGTLHYLGVPVIGGRLTKADCYHLIKEVHDRVARMAGQNSFFHGMNHSDQVSAYIFTSLFALSCCSIKVYGSQTGPSYHIFSLGFGFYSEAHHLIS